MGMNFMEGNARRFALIALSVYATYETLTTFVFILKRRVSLLQGIPIIPAIGVLFGWAMPILIAYVVESRDVSSLGLSVRREHCLAYALISFIGLILPAFFVRVDNSLLIEFIEQILYIGLAEEVFNRGYLLGRLRDWLGDLKGLLLSASLFGLSHILTLVSQHGFRYPLHDLMVGSQTFIGGLLLGYVYLRSNSIVLGSIIHVSTNTYLSRLLQ